MIIGIPVYPYVDLLDVAGPYEMFSWASGVRPVILSADGKPVTTVNGVTFEAHYSFAEAPELDVVWVPGGEPVKGLKPILDDPKSPYLEFVREKGAQAKWACSVCEGALLLAQTGLLDGHQATTHWDYVECLKRFPAVTVVPGTPRYVVSEKGSEKRLTGGGISSGLDESLKLIELLGGRSAAEEVQRITQYFPDPPVQARLPNPGKCSIDWKVA